MQETQKIERQSRPLFLPRLNFTAADAAKWQGITEQSVISAELDDLCVKLEANAKDRFYYLPRTVLFKNINVRNIKQLRKLAYFTLSWPSDKEILELEPNIKRWISMPEDEVRGVLWQMNPLWLIRLLATELIRPIKNILARVIMELTDFRCCRPLCPDYWYKPDPKQQAIYDDLCRKYLKSLIPSTGNQGQVDAVLKVFQSNIDSLKLYRRVFSAFVARFGLNITMNSLITIIPGIDDTQYEYFCSLDLEILQKLSVNAAKCLCDSSYLRTLLSTEGYDAFVALILKISQSFRRGVKLDKESDLSLFFAVVKILDSLLALPGFSIEELPNPNDQAGIELFTNIASLLLDYGEVVSADSLRSTQWTFENLIDFLNFKKTHPNYLFSQAYLFLSPEIAKQCVLDFKERGISMSGDDLGTMLKAYPDGATWHWLEQNTTVFAELKRCGEDLTAWVSSQAQQRQMSKEALCQFVKNDPVVNIIKHFANVDDNASQHQDHLTRSKLLKKFQEDERLINLLLMHSRLPTTIRNLFMDLCYFCVESKQPNVLIVIKLELVYFLRLHDLCSDERIKALLQPYQDITLDDFYAATGEEIFEVIDFMACLRVSARQYLFNLIFQELMKEGIRRDHPNSTLKRLANLNFQRFLYHCFPIDTRGPQWPFEVLWQLFHRSPALATEIGKIQETHCNEIMFVIVSGLITQENGVHMLVEYLSNPVFLSLLAAVNFGHLLYQVFGDQWQQYDRYLEILRVFDTKCVSTNQDTKTPEKLEYLLSNQHLFSAEVKAAIPEIRNKLECTIDQLFELANIRSGSMQLIEAIVFGDKDYVLQRFNTVEKIIASQDFIFQDAQRCIRKADISGSHEDKKQKRRAKSEPPGEIVIAVSPAIKKT